METVFVKAVFDIDCTWEGPNPAYRVFVNDELFTERTWLWQDSYIEETLQIQASPGKYHIRLEPVHLNQEKNSIITHRIEYGPARWVNTSLLGSVVGGKTVPPILKLIRPEKKYFNLVKFTVTNHRIEHGPARWIDNEHLEITHESQ